EPDIDSLIINIQPDDFRGKNYVKKFWNQNWFTSINDHLDLTNVSKPKVYLNPHIIPQLYTSKNSSPNKKYTQLLIILKEIHIYKIFIIANFLFNFIIE
ncbi:hypothetical protein BpHYR1_036744, partial [Brachionus plicatilis]